MNRPPDRSPFSRLHLPGYLGHVCGIGAVTHNYGWPLGEGCVTLLGGMEALTHTIPTGTMSKKSNNYLETAVG